MIFDLIKGLSRKEGEGGELYLIRFLGGQALSRASCQHRKQLTHLGR
jgi:hypothetical protein